METSPSTDPSGSPTPSVVPPVAERRTVTTEIHGETRTDDYEWLREKDSPEVTAYLEAENTYTQARTAHLAGLRQQIFDEIKARTRETDLSVPTRNRGHWYYGRSFEGKEYGASCRVPVRGPGRLDPPQPAEDSAPDQPALEGEQLLLDLDALAEGHEFFSLGGSSVSPDGHLLAWSTDVVGDERYTIRVKDLRDGRVLDDEIVGALGGATWDRERRAPLLHDRRRRPGAPTRSGATGSGPPRTPTSWSTTRPTPGSGSASAAAASDRFLMIASGSKTTTEYRYLDADAPAAGFQVFSERLEGLEYSLDHAVIEGRDAFLVLHNHTGADFELGAAPLEPTAGRAGGSRWCRTTPRSASRTSTRSPGTSSCTSAAAG